MSHHLLQGCALAGGWIGCRYSAGTSNVGSDAGTLTVDVVSQAVIQSLYQILTPQPRFLCGTSKKQANNQNAKFYKPPCCSVMVLTMNNVLFHAQCLYTNIYTYKPLLPDQW